MEEQVVVEQTTVTEAKGGRSPLVLIPRLYSVVVSALVFVNSVVLTTDFGFGRLSTLLLSVYYFLLSIVLCLAEFEITYVVENFHLLSHDFGKAFFGISIGILLLGNAWSQITAGVLMIIFGAFCLVRQLFLGKREERKEEEGQPEPELPSFDARQTPLTE